MQAPAFPAGWQTPVWSMLHAGLSDRADLPSEPLWRCPAMGVTADTVEYLALFIDAVEGAPLARHLWSPAYRDSHRALRVERSRVTEAVKRYHRSNDEG